ncbi:hypothetical protein L207DRAFT_346902 [Hyaloscypha variabilis F]|uniref:Uncharacterized protein n=1 Tax=Hyaloscypha variabilis (strain UAMH 11265 / GT02V1 / F) TaxID=1149755 RepID=A0A2J6RQS7_HYAVF|nr:hypothetical protein L207DRAFT_346902 [Hyaloscypha variabilis F]
MKTTLSLTTVFTLLLTLTSAAPPHPISVSKTTNTHINARSGTQTAAGILNIIGGAIPGPAGAIVGDVGKGLGGKGAAGAGTAGAAGAATTGTAKAAKAGAAGGAGGATKATAGKKIEGSA